MPYEFVKPLKSVAVAVNVVQDEDLVKAVAEEIQLEDPENADEIIKEATSGEKQTRVRRENSKQSSEKE